MFNNFCSDLTPLLFNATDPARSNRQFAETFRLKRIGKNYLVLSRCRAFSFELKMTEQRFELQQQSKPRYSFYRQRFN